MHDTVCCVLCDCDWKDVLPGSRPLSIRTSYLTDGVEAGARLSLFLDFRLGCLPCVDDEEGR